MGGPVAHTQSLHLSCSSIALQPLVVALMMTLAGLLQSPASASTGTVVSQNGPSEYGTTTGITGTHSAQETGVITL